jgi:hypothetical protein
MFGRRKRQEAEAVERVPALVSLAVKRLGWDSAVTLAESEEGVLTFIVDERIKLFVFSPRSALHIPEALIVRKIAEALASGNSPTDVYLAGLSEEWSMGVETIED